MTADQLSSIILEEVSNVAPEADLAQLRPEDDLRETLDLDSMDIFNLIVALSQRLDIDIPDVDARQLVSLKGAIDYLSARV